MVQEEAQQVQVRAIEVPEIQAHELARDVRTFTQWLRHDVLALAGHTLATRQALFDFLVEELAQREPADARRIRPVRVALQNRRYTLLALPACLMANWGVVWKVPFPGITRNRQSPDVA